MVRAIELQLQAQALSRVLQCLHSDTRRINPIQPTPARLVRVHAVVLAPYGLPLLLLATSRVRQVWLAMVPIYALLDALLLTSAFACVSWTRLSADLREGQSLASADGAAAAAASVELPSESLNVNSTGSPPAKPAIEHEVGESRVT